MIAGPNCTIVVGSAICMYERICCRLWLCLVLYYCERGTRFLLTNSFSTFIVIYVRILHVYCKSCFNTSSTCMFWHPFCGTVCDYSHCHPLYYPQSIYYCTWQYLRSFARLTKINKLVLDALLPDSLFCRFCLPQQCFLADCCWLSGCNCFSALHTWQICYFIVSGCSNVYENQFIWLCTVTASLHINYSFHMSGSASRWVTNLLLTWFSCGSWLLLIRGIRGSLSTLVMSPFPRCLQQQMMTVKVFQ